MCFSAEASFGASAVLLGIGVVSTNMCATTPQRVLASIPFIFGVQQFAEGILWLSLSHPGFAHLNYIASDTFLFFAQVVWPTIVPLAVLLLEKDARNKKVLGAMLGLGMLVSSWLGYCLLTYPVDAEISCSHILYTTHFPPYMKHMGVLYLIPTVFPSIISSIKRLRLLGVVILVSYIVARIFSQYYLISVWCFFAALISLVALSVIMKLNEKPELPANKLQVS